MQNVFNKEALEFVGPSFEQMTEDEMMNFDAEATPAAISISLLKLACSGVVSVAATFTIDRIFD